MSPLPATLPTAALDPPDLAALERAWLALERPSLAAQLSSVLGTPLERILRMLPGDWSRPVRAAAEAAVVRAYDLAAGSLDAGPSAERAAAPTAGSEGLHRVAAVATGALGGFFGLPALLVELPATTLLMLRAIADVARGHGERPGAPRTRLACIQVFALGGRSAADDHAELGYYELRLALAWQLAPALAANGAAAASAVPAPVGLLRAVGARFGLAVTDKVAAQAVPILGAFAGAAVNALFMEHFLAVADGHFTVRRLERRYGRPTVEAAYRAIGSRRGDPRPFTRAPRRRRNRPGA